MGLGITLVASLIYVIGWMFYVLSFAPDFADKYTASQITLIEASDHSEEEKELEIAAIRRMMEDYKKPHVMATYTFIEIFPVGLIISLISALALRKKKPPRQNSRGNGPS